jgi:hypothetical protein
MKLWAHLSLHCSSGITDTGDYIKPAANLQSCEIGVISQRNDGQACHACAPAGSIPYHLMHSACTPPGFVMLLTVGVSVCYGVLTAGVCQVYGLQGATGLQQPTAPVFTAQQTQAAR